jgi:hypothetical protein
LESLRQVEKYFFNCINYYFCVYQEDILKKKNSTKLRIFLKKLKKYYGVLHHLTIAIMQVFFFPFPPQQTNWDFFLKFFIFLVQILLIFLISGNFSNVFNITKRKKKEKKNNCFFLVMIFFILDFFFTTMKKHEEN